MNNLITRFSHLIPAFQTLGGVEMWPNVEYDESTYGTSNQTRVIIGPGRVRDSQNKDWLEWKTALTVNLATSGINGLLSGSRAADTFYYLYLIKHFNGTVSVVFSTDTGGIALPQGYRYWRQLRVVVRTGGNLGGGDIRLLPFRVTTGYPFRPLIIYENNYQVLTGQATSWTLFSVSDYVPPVSRSVLLKYEVNPVNNLYNNAQVRLPGRPDSQYNIAVPQNTSGVLDVVDIHQMVSASRQLEYIVSNSSMLLNAFARGFVVDGINN